MTAFYLIGLGFLFNGVYTRFNTIETRRDTFLKEYKKDYIIYDDQGFIRFLSNIYVLLGALILINSVMYDVHTNYLGFVFGFSITAIIMKIYYSKKSFIYFKRRFT